MKHEMKWNKCSIKRRNVHLNTYIFGVNAGTNASKKMRMQHILYKKYRQHNIYICVKVRRGDLLSKAGKDFSVDGNCRTWVCSFIEQRCLPVKWQNNYTHSAKCDSCECEVNTDSPTVAMQCFWSLLPLFESLLYLSMSASSSLQRNKLIGGRQSHGLTVRFSAWRILTVAKVFWMFSWPLHEFACYPSSP